MPYSFQILRVVDANESTLTSVAVSHSGRMLFAGTATGTLRSMKFPLTVPGEWTEYQGHGHSIIKVFIIIWYMSIITIQYWYEF